MKPTLRDPDLMHQIVLGSGKNHGLTVSCNCRRELGKHSRDKKDSSYYKPMIRVGDETVWQTYNKADNHWAPFEPKDRIRT